MRRLEGTSEAAKLVVTLALALSMVGIAQWIWDPADLPRPSPALRRRHARPSAPSASRTTTWSSSRVALAVAIGLRLLLYRTRMGVTMRASVDDRTLTTLNGASSVRSARSAWVVGCVLAALAGHPGRTDRDPLGHGADPAHRRRLRGLGHRAAAQHPDDLRRRHHPRSRGELLRGLPSRELLHPGLRGCGAGDRAVRLAPPASPVAAPRPRAAPQPRAGAGADVARHGDLRGGRRPLHGHRGDRGQPVRPLQPRPGVGPGHRRPVIGPGGRLRGTPLPLPDDLRRHRRCRGGPSGWQSAVASRRGGHLFRRRRPGGPSRPQAVGHLLRPLDRGLRDRHGRLGLSPPGLRPLRAPVRTLRLGLAQLRTIPHRRIGRSRARRRSSSSGPSSSCCSRHSWSSCAAPSSEAGCSRSRTAPWPVPPSA